jgi:hypothetical protein
VKQSRTRPLLIQHFANKAYQCLGKQQRPTEGKKKADIFDPLHLKGCAAIHIPSAPQGKASPSLTSGEGLVPQPWSLARPTPHCDPNERPLLLIAPPSPSGGRRLMTYEGREGRGGAEPASVRQLAMATTPNDPSSLLGLACPFSSYAPSCAEGKGAGGP